MSSSAPSEPKKDEKIKPKENPELKKKWAVPVDITSPCDDFHKRIPNPAFKVTLFALVQSFLLCVPFLISHISSFFIYWLVFHHQLISVVFLPPFFSPVAV